MTPLAVLTVLAATTVSEQPAPIGPEAGVPIVHASLVMAGTRIVESFIWPIPFGQPETFAWHYEQAYTKPPKFDPDLPFMRWDGDPLAVNVVGHALMGSEFYLRARQCRFGWAGSLGFAAAASAFWEYVFEANGARPSALDLVYTPLAGMGLGELRYFVHTVAGEIPSPAARNVVRGLMDPFGEMERFAGTRC